ncbi:CD63 antigen [Taenia crassiceps]|uniref:Tetraspanin n=1 Tax=Taenia crassiceps TaxID=6207 RepID=A0ABR4QLH7_9CEST
MALSTSGKFLKYVLVGFNVLVLVAGLFCLGFGAYIFVRLGGEGQISEVHAVPIFLIIVGIIVFLVGLMGCCGALVLDAFMLKAIKETVETYFADAITTYENTESESLKSTLFTIQKTFGCCGGKNPSDWGVNDTLNFCCKGKAPCPDVRSQFTEGCGEAVEVALSRKGLVAALCGWILAKKAK